MAVDLLAPFKLAARFLLTDDPESLIHPDDASAPIVKEIAAKLRGQSVQIEELRESHKVTVACAWF
jgi:hypothetical protein